MWYTIQHAYTFLYIFICCRTIYLTIQLFAHVPKLCNLSLYNDIHRTLCHNIFVIISIIHIDSSYDGINCTNNCYSLSLLRIVVEQIERYHDDFLCIVYIIQIVMWQYTWYASSSCWYVAQYYIAQWDMLYSSSLYWYLVPLDIEQLDRQYGNVLYTNNIVIIITQ